MKVLVVGNQPLYRMAILQLLQYIKPQLSYNEASDLKALTHVMGSVTWLFLLENRRERNEQIDRLISFKRSYPAMKIVWITELFGERELRCLGEGVINLCLPKRIDCESANSYFESLLKGGCEGFDVRMHKDLWKRGLFTHDLSSLNTTQLEVLRYLGCGGLNKQIADSMGLSLHSIKAQLSSIYKKLGVSNRVQAALVFQGIPAYSTYMVDIQDRARSLES